MEPEEEPQRPAPSLCRLGVLSPLVGVSESGQEGSSPCSFPPVLEVHYMWFVTILWLCYISVNMVFLLFYSIFFLMQLQGTVIQGCFFSLSLLSFSPTGIDLKQILIPPLDLPVETASRSCSSSSVFAEAALSNDLIYQSYGLTGSRRAQHRSHRGQKTSSL